MFDAFLLYYLCTYAQQIVEVSKHILHQRNIEVFIVNF
jgi:hypothetical protein